MNISQAAALSGLSPKTIRDYERAGLLAPPARSRSGYRQYSAADVDTLRFIKQAREVDFSLAQIAQLLALKHNPRRTSADVKALVGEHLHRLEQKIDRLNALKTTLSGWHARCQGDSSPECPIIDGLSHPAKEAKAVELG